jgi:hypothetical protein
MTLNDLKADFSQSYVRAVANASGYFIQESSRGFDADGIDLTMLARTAQGTVQSPRLDLQLKATEHPINEDPFPFDLRVKNYNELRSEQLQVPRILVVVCVPMELEAWVSATNEELILRHCGYWKSLRGEPPTENATSVRVWIRCDYRFHVGPVRELMSRIRDGGLP